MIDTKTGNLAAPASHCTAPSSIFETLLAFSLALGIILSYAPQQITILRRRTIEGISPFFLLLMNMGAGLNLGNILLESVAIFRCCPSVTGWICLNSLMGLVQITAAFIGPFAVLVLSAQCVSASSPEYSEMQWVLRVVMALDTAVAVAVAYAWGSAMSRPMANFLGSVCAIVGIYQYLPQLLTTYRLKHTGSLSKATLLIQIPGGYLWCLSLYMRHGSVWSTWLPIFVAATLQAVLLAMALWFEFRTTHRVLRVMASPSADGDLSGHELDRSRTSSPGSLVTRGSTPASSLTESNALLG